MKTLNIGAAVALSIVSVSVGAKDVDHVGVVDNGFAYTGSASGSQPVVIGSAIEGDFSSQIAVAVGAGHAISGGGGHAISGGGGHAISGGGGQAISGGGGHAISGGGGHAISGGGGHAISGGGGHAISGGGGK